eukprot:COSAG06_NODE_15398_length_1073_cov_4.329569_1_plen_101_part_10
MNTHVYCTVPSHNSHSARDPPWPSAIIGWELPDDVPCARTLRVHRPEYYVRGVLPVRCSAAAASDATVVLLLLLLLLFISAVSGCPAVFSPPRHHPQARTR